MVGVEVGVTWSVGEGVGVRVEIRVKVGVQVGITWSVGDAVYTVSGVELLTIVS